MKYPLLDEIGEHFMDKAVELVKKGHKFIYVLDNIDWTVKVHDVRSDKQNISVHAVATSLVFNRIPSKHFAGHTSQQSLATVNVRTLVTPSEEEMVCTRERYKILLANILCEFLQTFHHFQDLVIQLVFMQKK